MRLILILFTVFVVLGGGAAGAYFYFMNNAEAAIDPDQELAAVEEEKVDPLLLSLVEMDPVLVPVVDRDGVSQVVTLIIGLEITSGAYRDKVRELSPKLKNAYIQDMYGVLNRHAMLKGGTLEVDLIKERLGKISQRILGKDVLHELKLQAVQQRPV